MDNEPDHIGTIIGWIVAMVASAVATLQKFGGRLFGNPTKIAHEQLAESIGDVGEKLDRQNDVLTEIATKIAVYDERFTDHERRLSRLER